MGNESNTLPSSSSVRIKLSLQKVQAQFGPTPAAPSPPASATDKSPPNTERTQTEDRVNDTQTSIDSVINSVPSQVQQNGVKNTTTLSPLSTTISKKAMNAALAPLGSGNPDMSFYQTIRQIGQFASLTFHVHRVARCGGSCTCICHYSSRLQSPRFLDRFFGNLFIGYAGLPV
jgi:hypothetical protein